MVKHSTGSRRSSSSKSRAAPQSQLSRLKDLSLLDSPSSFEKDTSTPNSEGEGFPDDVYFLASAIFQNSHLEKAAAHRLISYGEKTERPLPEVKDETTQRAAYELAFSALKYQELLEDIMIDSCFYLSQPMPVHQMSLVAVMLYDFQDRKFLPQERPAEKVIQEVREVENCLLRFKTKLAASLARCRIKHDLLTIDCILPESVRQKQDRASTLPLYAWVHPLQSSLEEVCSVLQKEGVAQVKGLDLLRGEVFCRDPHCEDTLVFPAALRELLQRTKLLLQQKLVIQDKSCMVGACAVRPLLPEGDVLVAGSFSGLTVAHVALQVAQRHTGRANHSKVYACVGQWPAAQREELHQTVVGLGCKNVRLIPESFLSLELSDTRLQKVRVILLTPQCSVSAICNPVDFILQENGDPGLLQDLSHGSITPAKLDTLVAQQKKNIGHALKFPKVQAVVYSTCSSYAQENEEVVMKALEQARPPPPSPGPEKADAVDTSPKIQAFRPCSTLPACLSGPEGCEARAACPFFTLEPSAHSNGCFMAVLAREPEPVEVDSVQDVLARADATGLLDGLGKPIRKESRARRNQRTENDRELTAQSRSHGNFLKNLSRGLDHLNRETKGSSSASSFGREKPAPKGKPKASVQRPSKPCASRSQPVASSSFSSSPYGPPKAARNPSSHKSPSRIVSTVISSTRPTFQVPQPSPPHSTPVPFAVVTPPKGRQAVLRPVALILPPKMFPGSYPSSKWAPPASVTLLHSDPILYPWKADAILPQVLHSQSNGCVNKRVQSRPWF